MATIDSRHIRASADHRIRIGIRLEPMVQRRKNCPLISSTIPVNGYWIFLCWENPTRNSATTRLRCPSRLFVQTCPKHGTLKPKPSIRKPSLTN